MHVVIRLALSWMLKFSLLGFFLVACCPLDSCRCNGDKPNLHVVETFAFETIEAI